MKAAIYTRVSTENQEREGTSLDSQLEACLKLAEDRGYEVPREFILSETYSGSSLDRPKLNEMRRWVRDSEVDAIIVYTLDRLSRDPVHFIILQEELERAGVELILATEDIDSSDMGKLIAYIKGYAAKLEAEKIKERTMRGKLQRALQGRIPFGGFRLYGYDYIKGKRDGEGIRRINEAEIKWVKEIYHWLVEEHLTIYAIARRLTAMGVPTPGGGRSWVRQTVHNILTNPAYLGRTYYLTRTNVEPKRRLNPDAKKKKTTSVWKPKDEWKEIKDATPSVISEELFGEAQRTLKRNKELSSRNAKRQYLLSGYIFCQPCGRRYIGFTHTRLRKDGIREHRYYRCGETHCDNCNLNATIIEQAVWEQIEAILSWPELVMAELQDRREEADKTGFLERNLETTRARLKYKQVREGDRIHRAFYVTGNEERFKRDMAILAEEIKTLKEEEANTISRIEAGRKLALDVEGIKKACELVKDNLASLTFENKRLALEALQIRVVVDGLDVNIEGIIPIQPCSVVSASSESRSSAERAASVSAAFLLFPVPLPSTVSPTLTSTVKLLSWSGPFASST